MSMSDDLKAIEAQFQEGLAAAETMEALEALRVSYLGKKGQKPHYDDVDSLPMKTAFLIGCFQMLALIPGTSRSGVTIIGALLLGASRSAAAESAQAASGAPSDRRRARRTSCRNAFLGVCWSWSGSSRRAVRRCKHNVCRASKKPLATRLKCGNIWANKLSVW